MDATAAALQHALLYVLIPLWFLVGFADYLCHRVQHIEHSAGVKEALIHLLLIFELGFGFLAALLLEINAGAFAVLIGILLLHELTAWWDLAYAASRRRIPVPEQWVHGLQESLPWVGLAGLMVLHPDQSLALFGLGTATPDWTLNPRPPPLPPKILGGFALAGFLLVALPFVAEFRRCRSNRSILR